MLGVTRRDARDFFLRIYSHRISKGALGAIEDNNAERQEHPHRHKGIA